MSDPIRVDEQPVWRVALVEVIFIAVAVGIIYFRQSFDAVASRLPLVTEAAMGLPLGAILGLLVGFGLLHSPLRRHVVQGVLPLRPVISSVWSVVVVGVLAGFAEELLFRAALIAWIGLVWASVLFGLAHSGTARLHQGLSVGKMVYLLATVVAGLLLGWLYETVGLPAAMSAHAAFDITLLLVLAPAITTAAREATGAAER
jgi:membrane protease YdiL (CAAX protease family)